MRADRNPSHHFTFATPSYQSRQLRAERAAERAAIKRYVWRALRLLGLALVLILVADSQVITTVSAVFQ